MSLRVKQEVGPLGDWGIDNTVTDHNILVVNMFSNNVFKNFL